MMNFKQQVLYTNELPLIGLGSTCKVYMTEVMSQKFALKVFNLDISLEDRKQEIETLQTLKLDSIVRLEDSYDQDEYRWVLLEKFGDQTLLELVKNHKYDFELVLKIYHQLSHFIEQIHKQNFIFGDLKLENILIDLKSQQIKVCDFGMAQSFESQNKYMGTIGYLAPEQLNQGAITSKVDYFQLGVVIFTLVYKRFPFTDIDLWNLILEQNLYQYQYKNN
ncbi:hypothetical protein pb186bvf_012946 [Paramecium bursaria]